MATLMTSFVARRALSRHCSRLINQNFGSSIASTRYFSAFFSEGEQNTKKELTQSRVALTNQHARFEDPLYIYKRNYTINF